MKKLSRKTIFILAGLLVLAAIVLILPGIGKPKDNASQYQTETLQKGSLIAKVSNIGSVKANQSAVLSWQTSGTVSEILVHEGDIVSKDQELIKLDLKTLPQSLLASEVELPQARKNLENLKNSNVEQATAYQNMIQAQDAVDKAREKLQSKSYNRADPNAIDEARANLVMAENAVTRATEAYDQVDSLGENDPNRAEMFSQLARARQNRDMKLANLNWLLGHPDEQELAAANANLEVALAKLKDATREWERLKNGPDPNDVKAAEIRVASLEATIGQYHLTAPFNGTIMILNHQTGDMVTPGQTGVRIDDISQLFVDLEIPEVYISQIEVGQKADMTFDALGSRLYHGKVTKVARVGTNKTGSAVNFTVTVLITDPDTSVTPGMTASVSIITTQLENALIIPNRAVRFVDGERVIYILRDNKPAPVKITIGASSDTHSEVISGDLKEGDLIILTPPQSLHQMMGGE